LKVVPGALLRVSMRTATPKYSESFREPSGLTSPRLIAMIPGPRILLAAPWRTAATKIEGKSGRSTKITSAKPRAAIPRSH
jgi:hypothetical protein